MPSISEEFRNEIDDLRSKLGFLVHEESYDPRNFDNGLLVLRGAGIWIRLIRDRSQIFIDLAANTRKWISADDLLGDLDPPVRLPADPRVCEIISAICDRIKEIKHVLKFMH
jgi:hypothetical protein